MAEPASYDLEGHRLTAARRWWVVSEGAKDFGAEELTKNLLIRVNQDGSVAEEVELPEAINQEQRSNGFEGVTTNGSGSEAYVAFQREWADDPAGLVKIGRYTPCDAGMGILQYPLDACSGRWLGGPVGDLLARRQDLSRRGTRQPAT